MQETQEVWAQSLGQEDPLKKAMVSLSIHRVLARGPLGHQQPWKLKSLMDNGIERAECTDIIKRRWT